jgi:YfiH family protein
MNPSQYVNSELLSRAGFQHAFFTRQGGVSSAAYASLNLSLDVGDRAEDVAENRCRVARVLGVSEERVLVPRQVHGSDVLWVGEAAIAEDVARRAADGIIADAPGLACAVRTADCVPILMADRETRRVAAVHAGWRGVVQGVAPAAVRFFRARGSRPEHLLAAIGPHISPAAFEVGKEVAEQLAAASPTSGAVTSLTEPKAHVDLTLILIAQLEQMGVPVANVDVLPGCTFLQPERFFSYRRDGKASGRQVSAIVSQPIRGSHGGHPS